MWHLRRAVPPGGRPHAVRPRDPEELPLRDRRRNATWTPAAVIEEQVARIRAQVGDGRVICGLSGGVDSAVAALLVYKAVGDQLTCVFVDHGFLRKGEAEQVGRSLRHTLPRAARAVDAEQRFLDKLAGVTEPEEKRKLIGTRVHPRLRRGGAEARGGPLARPGNPLLRRDRVRRHRRRRQTIKRHHNVGGLPADMKSSSSSRCGALQGRGETRRRRTGIARAVRLAPAVPGPRPRDQRSSAARPPSASRHSARPTRSCRKRSAAPGSIASSGSRSPCCPIRSVGVQGDSRTYGYRS